MFYFRIAVPRSQRDSIKKTEIRRSLRTKDRKVAAHRARTLATGLITVEQNGIKIVVDRPDNRDEELKVAKELLREAKASTHQKEPEQESKLLSVIIEEYCQEKIKEGSWYPKTEAENRAIYTQFLEIVGDVPINVFKQGMARGYKANLQKIPANRNKKRHLSIQGQSS